jgi:hypothetical protein
MVHIPPRPKRGRACLVSLHDMFVSSAEPDYKRKSYGINLPAFHAADVCWYDISVGTITLGAASGGDGTNSMGV